MNLNSEASNCQADAQNFLLKSMNVDKKLRDTVFPRMLADHVSLVAKSDLIICAYGARYLKTHRDKHFINVTSRNMRELAKILIAVKKNDPAIKNFFHALQPKTTSYLLKQPKLLQIMMKQMKFINHRLSL